ncbi:ABC-2 type transport system permease protein [Bowdeniella nasicola]|uniref:ABC-2 type transport system permease protein n=1 Tax=Bowdeniella nasicola TaxID=208480 RepID=A0A1H4A313_9ACTO|nr:ABC transporter permease [Bowdeniella nasicola]SEA30021.1 ABC-2 type transport system permease protein [Bowdeniella nasicola]
MSALAAQVRAEVTRFRRLPEYVVGVVLLPVILFAMFGLTNRDNVLPSGLAVPGILVVSFAAYGVVSQSLFSFGSDLATERAQGWLRRMRATPMTMTTYFGGKLAMNIIFAIAMVALLLATASLFGKVDFHWPRALAAAAICVSGAIWFAPFGAAIAYWARPGAATTIVNLVFLPLSFLSGFFMPLAQLPEVFQKVAPFLPTYHFGALAWRTLAEPADLEFIMTDPAINLWLSAGIVAAWFLAASVLAIAGYRLEQRRERR